METRVIKHGAGPTVSPSAEKPTPPRSASPPGRPYFVGRRDVLESLYGTMGEAATKRQLRLIALVGPAGIGKSRLVEELQGILKSSGNPIGYYHLKLADPSAPPVISQMLHQRFELKADESSVREKLDALQLGLSGMVPTSRLDDATRLIASLMGLGVDEAGNALQGFEPEVIRSERFRKRAKQTGTNLLRYDVSRRPHLVLLDDWDRAARPDDLKVIEALLDQVVDCPLCVIVMSRAKLSPPPAIRAPGELTQVELVPINDVDVKRFVSGLLENVSDVPDDVIDEMVKRAAGNPSMAEELVRLLLSRGVVRAVPIAGKQKWIYEEKEQGRPTARTLPSGLKESVRERLAGLPEHERALLEAAAVFGSVFWPRGVVSLLRTSAPYAELRATLDHDPAGMKIEGALMTLCERGYFTTHDEQLVRGPAALTFKSADMRVSAYENFAPEPRARLHRLAQQWLGSQKPVDRLHWLEVRAGHAETGKLARKAAQLYLEAGVLARERNDPTRAVELLRRGLSLVDDDSAQLARDLLAQLAQTYLETSVFDEAERCLQDGLHFSRLLDDAVATAQAHTLLGEVTRARGQYDQSTKHLEYALTLFGEAEHTEGTADAKEAMARLLAYQGDKDALRMALEHLKQALKIRKSLGDPLRTAQTLTNVANIQHARGELDKAILNHQEALSIRERHSDRRGVLLTLTGLGGARYDNAQHDEAVALWERGLKLAIEVGDRTQHTLLLMHLGEQRLESGHLETAEPALTEALNTATELGLARLQGLAGCLLSALHLAQGSETEALACAQAALDCGYSIESKQVIGHALLAKARAMSNALFIDSADGEERMRRASECFQQAITLLEEMGNKPTLARALDAYGVFLVERGVKNKGKKAIQRADQLRRAMRGDEQEEKAFHQARTIRRTYQPVTGPIDHKDIAVIMGMVKRGKKRLDS